MSARKLVIIPTMNNTTKVGINCISDILKVKYGGTKKKSKNATAITDAIIPPFRPATKPLKTIGIMNIIGILIASKNGLKKKQIIDVSTMLNKLIVNGLK